MATVLSLNQVTWTVAASALRLAVLASGSVDARTDAPWSAFSPKTVPGFFFRLLATRRYGPLLRARGDRKGRSVFHGVDVFAGSWRSGTSGGGPP
jgi:hypothetical protein